MSLVNACSYPRLSFRDFTLRAIERINTIYVKTFTLNGLRGKNVDYDLHKKITVQVENETKCTKINETSRRNIRPVAKSRLGDKR